MMPRQKQQSPSGAGLAAHKQINERTQIIGDGQSADKADDQPMQLVANNAEARVDTRVLAAQLGSRHQSALELIKDHRADFEELGLLRFQTGEIRGRGQPERFALLNEDQCYLLLTYSRNTARARQLKVRLVKAFRDARRAAQHRQTEYLPTYHALHERIHVLAGESSNERFVHMNLNKLINKAAGLDAGQRTTVALPQQSMLVVAQAVAARALQGAHDHHDGYRRAKDALLALAAVTMLEAR